MKVKNLPMFINGLIMTICSLPILGIVANTLLLQSFDGDGVFDSVGLVALFFGGGFHILSVAILYHGWGGKENEELVK